MRDSSNMPHPHCLWRWIQQDIQTESPPQGSSAEEDFYLTWPQICIKCVCTLFTHSCKCAFWLSLVYTDTASPFCLIRCFRSAGSASASECLSTQKQFRWNWASPSTSPIRLYLEEWFPHSLWRSGFFETVSLHRDVEALGLRSKIPQWDRILKSNCMSCIYAKGWIFMCALLRALKRWATQTSNIKTLGIAWNQNVLFQGLIKNHREQTLSRKVQASLQWIPTEYWS